MLYRSLWYYIRDLPWNFGDSDVNVSNWPISLHHLVKLKMLIADVLSLSTSKERNSRIYPTFNAAFKFARLESGDDRVRLVCKGGVRSTHHWAGAIDDATDEWLPRYTMATWSSLAHTVFPCSFISSRSEICVLYTFSCSIPTRCNQLASYKAGHHSSGAKLHRHGQSLEARRPKEWEQSRTTAPHFGRGHSPGIPFVYKKSSASRVPEQWYFHDLAWHCSE